MPPKVTKQSGAQPSNYPTTRASTRSTVSESIESAEDSSPEESTPAPNLEQSQSIDNKISDKDNHLNLHTEQNLQETTDTNLFEMSNLILLPPFSDESFHVPTVWWGKFEAYKTSDNMNDESAVASLFFHLIGQAGLRFTTLDTEIRNNFCALKAASLERFPIKTSNNQIYQLHQLAQESGQQYLTRVQQLAIGVSDLSERAIVQIAVNGMKSDIKPFVIGREPNVYRNMTLY